MLGFSPHRGVTNRGARVDAAHARARERTTRDTGEDGPRDELSRVESSRVESSRVDARRVSRETTREDEESEERNESRRRFGNSPGGGQRVVTRVRGDDGHPRVREGRPEGFVPPGGEGARGTCAPKMCRMTCSTILNSPGAGVLRSSPARPASLLPYVNNRGRIVRRKLPPAVLGCRGYRRSAERPSRAARARAGAARAALWS